MQLTVVPVLCSKMLLEKLLLTCTLCIQHQATSHCLTGHEVPLCQPTAKRAANAAPGSCVPNFCLVCCSCFSWLMMAALPLLLFVSRSTSCGGRVAAACDGWAHNSAPVRGTCGMIAASRWHATCTTTSTVLLMHAVIHEIHVGMGV